MYTPDVSAFFRVLGPLLDQVAITVKLFTEILSDILFAYLQPVQGVDIVRQAGLQGASRTQSTTIVKPLSNSARDSLVGCSDWLGRSCGTPLWPRSAWHSSEPAHWSVTYSSH